MMKILSTKDKAAALLLATATLAAVIAIAVGQPAWARGRRTAFRPSWHRPNLVGNINERLRPRRTGIPQPTTKATTATTAATATMTATDPSATGPTGATTTPLDGGATSTTPVDSATSTTTPNDGGLSTTTPTDGGFSTTPNDGSGTTAAPCTSDDCVAIAELNVLVAPQCDACAPLNAELRLPSCVPVADRCSSESLCSCGCTGCTSLTIDDCYIETRTGVLGIVAATDVEVGGKACVIFEETVATSVQFSGFQCVIMRGANVYAEVGRAGGEHTLMINSNVPDACAFVEGTIAADLGVELQHADAYVGVYGSTVLSAEAGTVIVAGSADVGSITAAIGADAYVLVEGSTVGSIFGRDGDDIIHVNAGQVLDISAGAGDDSVTTVEATVGGIDGETGDDCLLSEILQTATLPSLDGGVAGIISADECTVFVQAADDSERACIDLSSVVNCGVNSALNDACVDSRFGLSLFVSCLL